MTRNNQAILLFDGQCAFCTRSSLRLQRWAGNRLRRVPSQAKGALELHPRLSSEGTQARINLVTADGKLYGGAEAIARVVVLNPFGCFAWLYHVPGVRQLANAGYRFIARNRYRWWGRINPGTCDGNACRINE